MSSADRADRRAECAALLETLEEKETKVKKDLEATRAHIEQAKADLGDRFKDIPGFAREIVMLYAVAPYTILEALLDKNIAETEEHTRRVREKAAMLEDTERHAEALEELQEKFRAL